MSVIYYFELTTLNMPLMHMTWCPTDSDVFEYLTSSDISNIQSL